ncbi:MAG: hypothetical protein M0Q44_02570 [Methylobacter sp.]|jgi:F0F1-type ATP synthase membrane subunit a|nr:hypothetical protein [Methylobacter sp.]
MELISELFNDPIMQSMIFGPIMGVIFAVLFAGLTERPTTLVPVTVIQTREIYITRVIERRGRRSDSEEGGGILVVAGMGLLFVLWKYAIYVNEIHQYIGMVPPSGTGFATPSLTFLQCPG